MNKIHSLQTLVLFATYRFPGIHSKELIRAVRKFDEEYLEISSPGINTAAKKLETSGMLVREPEGKKFFLHQLTPKGDAAAKKLLGFAINLDQL